ncbi:MAG: hypothetical protein NVSMB38_10530 [Ktedonobacteraceae bacterium]
MIRRVLALSLITLALIILILTPIIAFTPVGDRLSNSLGLVTPTPSATPVPFVPTPVPSPSPVLTVKGPPPALTSSAAYLEDIDTGTILVNSNGEKTLPMASTTKIMTAVIAIQTGDLNQGVTITQDAVDEPALHNGSSAYLRFGDVVSLRDLLYGLLLPSGDDAAIAIADDLAGSPDKFVQRMNLFAHRLHLYQTHYTNPDGLTPDGQTNPNHYTTAADLVRLARYAMSLPLFAQIVQKQTYTLEATALHHRYTWTTTNDLLGAYTGVTGIKTGHTEEAGYCLVFSAMRAGHHLMGVVLHSNTVQDRFNDTKALLDWGFSLPMLPPT